MLWVLVMLGARVEGPPQTRTAIVVPASSSVRPLGHGTTSVELLLGLVVFLVLMRHTLHDDLEQICHSFQKHLFVAHSIFASTV